MSDQHFWQRVQKAMIERILIQDDKETAAKLLDSEIDAFCVNSWNGIDYWEVQLTPQLADFDYLVSKKEQLSALINDILRGRAEECSSLEICHPLPELEEDWRENLRVVIRGEKITNQGVLVSTAPYEYKGLYFRSKTEIAIAQALDRAKVLYFPLPVACYGGRKREPDFLVRSPSGKWGILEIQGESFHPASRADQDHDRSRGFKKLGIAVEFYSSERCYRDPDGVVAEFLRVISAI